MHKEADLHKCGLTRKDLIQKLPSLASRFACTATKPSQNMTLKATETLQRYDEDSAQSLSEVRQNTSDGETQELQNPDRNT